VEITFLSGVAMPKLWHAKRVISIMNKSLLLSVFLLLFFFAAMAQQPVEDDANEGKFYMGGWPRYGVLPYIL
jgi:hypothetical protein